MTQKNAPRAASDTGIASEAPDSDSICSRCQRSFRCGAAAGDAQCWCFGMPALTQEPNSNNGCFCPDCLAKMLAEQGGQGFSG